ncbi:hypothetical protein FRC09_008416 [Ceratobasidium sp. 395]|nr:hypothetical protein FRC09_008416 [Ceratobasidium sp. 395]
MPDYKSKCSTWSNDRLIFKEVSHRRAIASYITSLTLTAVTTIVTAGVAAPLMLPIGAYKLYKINSHKSKLKTVRAELAKRNVSPKGKRKRDVVVPVAFSLSIYVVTFGLADIVDVVPADIQGAFEHHVEDVTNIEHGAVEEGGVGDKYEALVMVEAVDLAARQGTRSSQREDFKHSKNK